MPQIKLDKIKEFSSEDTANNLVANNLLRTSQYKSWKCKEWDSISFVIFELSKPTLIDSIEIGNDCSAFVEVLVSNTSQIKQRYQVLLSTSSFMTPSESHSLNNCNRVRIFNKEKLSPNSIDERWDLIKVVCTQPFNKSIRYGLSFIRLNSPSDDNEEELEASTTSLNIGPFRLKTKDEEQESEDVNRRFTAGSLFAKRSNNTTDESSDAPKRQSLAAAVGITPPKTRNHSQSDSKTSTSVRPKQSIQKTAKLNQKPIISSANTSSNSSNTTSSQQQGSGPSPPKRQRKIKTKPFHQLMSKVSFVLSGFVNPKRGQLRDKAIEMGAKYKANWDTSCTHLVCAFDNTPKFNEVKAKNGKIVNEKWIEDCYAQRKLLPWRSYMRGKYNGPDSSESEEDEEEEQTNNTNQVQYIDADEEDSPESQSSSQGLFNRPNDTQVKEVIGLQDNNNDNDSQDIDIDKNDEIYDAETDSESNADTVTSSQEKDSGPIPSSKSLDIFKDKYFHIYGSFDNKEKQVLTQYITSYKGKLEENLTSNVKYVITNSDWNQDFEEACSMNESLVFVKPKWIHKCHENSKLLPFQPFVVSCNYD